MAFVRTESDNHHRAKHRLARWLAKAAPDHHVWVEYPFGPDGEGLTTWLSQGFERKPSFRTLRARGIIAACVCDIAVADPAHRITDVFEVVRGHYTPGWKEAFLKGNGLRVYEVHASSVLALKAAPSDISTMLTEL